MAPKRKTRKKKRARANKRDPDGKNAVTVKSEGTLSVEKIPRDYTMAITSEATWDTLGGIPCFTCINVKKCGVRQPISPVSCSAINAWLEYESLPPKERQLRTPEFWTETENRRNLKPEGTES